VCERKNQRGHSLNICCKEQLQKFRAIPILGRANKGLMTMINKRFPQDGEHRSEPEIIPPGHTDIREMESRFWGRVSTNEGGFHRIYVSRIGPFGLLPFFLLTGFFVAAMLVFALGAFLILLPLAGFVVAAALFAGLLRGRSRWPR
jgi:hypothetical protein